MLLIVVVPAVSRSMPMSSMSSTMGADCAMGAARVDHHAPAMPTDPDDPTAKCGYCSLLTHTPVVAFDVGIVLMPAYLTTLAPENGALRDAPVSSLLSARPRGPPRFPIG
jgi:hypothetical protein